MQSGLVSVIIPVYNVENYLDRCLESVINQTYDKLEIILIDDGSQDKSPLLCDRWAKKDSRIKVIHKTNEGLGIARNVGIEYAQGQYICFFDSDDYVALNTIEESYGAAQRHHADVVCFGVHRVDSKGAITSSRVPKTDKLVYKDSEICDCLLPNLIGPNPKNGKDYAVPMSACCKLFSLRIIRENGWRFVSEREIISEDYYSLLSLYKNLSVMCIIPQAFYYYCENSQSLSRKYRSDRFEEICHFYYESRALCERLGYNSDVIYQIDNMFLSLVISVLKQEYDHFQSFSDKRKRLKSVIDDVRIQSVLLAHENDVLEKRKQILYWAIRRRFYLMVMGLLAIRKLKR